MASIHLDNEASPSMAADPEGRKPLWEAGSCRRAPILVSDDEESECSDFSDSQSEASLPSLDTVATSASKDVNATRGASDGDTGKPSVDVDQPDSESSQHRPQTGGLEGSPAPPSAPARPAASSGNPPQGEREPPISIDNTSHGPVPENAARGQSAEEAISAPSPGVEARHLPSQSRLSSQPLGPEDAPHNLAVSSNFGSQRPETQPTKARPGREHGRKRARRVGFLDRSRDAPSDNDENDYRPPSLDSGGEWSESDDELTQQPPRKRPKAAPAARATHRTAAAHRRSTGPTAPLEVDVPMRCWSCHSIPAPPHSQSSSDRGTPAEALAAVIKRLLMDATVISYATVNDVRTFQIQLREDLYCPNHRHSTKQGARPASITGKNTLPSQTVNDTRPPASMDEESEGEVEQILDTRKRGRGYQVLVQRVGDEKPTWERLGDHRETKALDDYEALYGKVGEL